MLRIAAFVCECVWCLGELLCEKQRAQCVLVGVQELDRPTRFALGSMTLYDDYEGSQS